MSTPASILAFPTPPSGRYDEASRLYRAGDHAAAVRILLELLDDGYFNAHVFLSLIYRVGGGGVVRDDFQAFSHALAAIDTVGHPEAYLFTAMHYALGIGVEQDHFLAKHHYMTAFRKFHHPVAALGLGRLYESKDLGAPNLPKAIAYYRVAERNKLSFASRYIARCLIKQHRYAAGVAYHIYATFRGIRQLREIGESAARTW